MIEPLANGIEATVGVIEFEGRIRILEPVEIRLSGEGSFDYAHKYLDPSVAELCPSTFSIKVIAELQKAAAAAHLMIGARGYSRSDFIVQRDSVIFLEINTLPGLTAASLLPKALKTEKIGMREFLLSQIDLAGAAK